MKLVQSLIVVASVATTLALVACSSDSSSGSSACQQAKTVIDSCNAKPQDGGLTVTTKFDSAQCEGSDQAKKAAQCIVDNKSNCDCIIKCSLQGSC
jgi:hypothetical protein